MVLTYREGFWVLVVLLVLGWCGSVEYRVRQAPPTVTTADNWLFQNTNVNNEAGEPMSRAMLLDQLVASSVQQQTTQPPEIGNAPQ